jgi:hypothetical protein
MEEFTTISIFSGSFKFPFEGREVEIQKYGYLNFLSLIQENKVLQKLTDLKLIESFYRYIELLKEVEPWDGFTIYKNTFICHEDTPIFRFDEFITVLVTSIIHNIDVSELTSGKFSVINMIPHFIPSIRYIEPK